MITLVLNNIAQLSILESMLIRYGIEYETEIKETGNILEPPHLIVDGVPLDFERSCKWIGEQNK